VSRLALHFLFFLSGAAALGYQLVWSKMFSTGLGHEMPAVLAIIGAVMAGMALGAAWLDRFIPRDARAGFWLGGLELTIGLWAVLASLAIPHLTDWVLRVLGLAPHPMKHWMVAFAVPALVLLPATAAMGATLPAMEKFLSVVAPKYSSIGSVYGANTLGAVFGTLMTPYVLMPALGLSRSCWLLAALNAAAGVGAFVLARTGLPKQEVSRNDVTPLENFSRPRLAATLFATGLLGIGYETSGVRVLTQVLEGTVYTYAAVLAVFLFGTAAGAVAYHRWWRGRDSSHVGNNLFAGTAAACLFSIAFLAQTPALYRTARGLGDSMAAVLGAELLTSLAVFALPTFCMGALFSHLVQWARMAGGRIGDVVAWNTLGAALGPALSVLLLPRLGAQFTLCIFGAGYFLLARPRGRMAVVVTLALLPAAVANLRLVDVPPGGRVVEFREGIMASVAVLADTNGHRTLRVDNRFQMGGTAAADAEYRQAHLPLLLHPDPQRVLFLGVGTGISLGASSLHTQPTADGVELVPEVVEVMHFFEPQNFSPPQQPRIKVHIADARRFVRAQDVPPGYDVIVADLFHPYRDGAGALYTREHFAAVRRQLNSSSHALFCQWLPLHQIDEATLRIIVRTFQAEFPFAEAWLLRFNVDVPVVALIGGRELQPWATNHVESRLGEPRLESELKRLALADSLRLYGHLLAGADDLRAFAGDAPLNTDDNQRVTFLAPRAAYRHSGKPYSSLLTLLAVSKVEPAVALHLPEQKEFANQLQAYFAARNVYLHGLVHEAENRRDDAMAAYLESARLSPDFTSGYAQCLTFATVIAQSEPTRARRILERLVEAQPQRPVAREMLERLFRN
jgi:spermidine synthase